MPRFSSQSWRIPGEVSIDIAIGTARLLDALGTALWTSSALAKVGEGSRKCQDTKSLCLGGEEEEEEEEATLDTKEYSMLSCGCFISSMRQTDDSRGRECGICAWEVCWEFCAPPDFTRWHAPKKCIHAATRSMFTHWYIDELLGVLKRSEKKHSTDDDADIVILGNQDITVSDGTSNEGHESANRKRPRTNCFSTLLCTDYIGHWCCHARILDYQYALWSRRWGL